MDVLSTFLPNDRRHALAEGRPLPDRATGAALFADISGFTALTAALRRELGARRGAEEIIHHIDVVFTDLIDRIHRYHGNVIGFSGDAITCWFGDDDDGGGSSRAVAAAFALQAVMARIETITTPAGLAIPLAIKVAVATGPARRFLVGDPHTYVIEIIAGATVDRTAAAERLADRGEVIVDAATVAGLTNPPVVAAWRQSEGERYAVLSSPGDQPLPPEPPEPPDIDNEAARSWLLPPVCRHLMQGGETFLAELRPAVPFFVRFGGIDYDGDDEAEQKLDAFVRRVQTVLDRYEGFLVQITMGDKGSYLYICFGAPIAHENDPARAMSAALAIRESAAELPWLDPLRIGISRGLVQSGAYGGSRRRTFAAMGNEVNITARLMTHARPGQILVSARMVEAAGAELIANPLPPIQLKGVDEPFAVYELVGRSATPRAGGPAPATTMVARAAERAQLDEALAELVDGRSRAVLIEGAAGMGKSLLMAELAHKAAAVPGALVLAGGGDAIEQSTPYFGWRPVFEALLDIHHRPDWRDELAARLDPAARPFLPLLNAVLPLDLPDNDITAQLAGEARQDNIQELLLGLLRSVAGGSPLVVLLDDAHWLDSASWALADRARREVAPLLLALVSRPLGDDAPAAYAEIAAAPGTRRITLDALSPTDIEALVALRLGVAGLPREIVDLIQEKAEGHPFFSEELAFALRDAGLLRVSGGVARVSPGADLTALDFPTTIQGIITSRIDRLSASQQLTVKVASVIGRIFALRVLTGVYPVAEAEAQLRADLARLERLDITPLETPEPNLAYIFKHIVMQEVVYSLMTTDQRRRLHRNTAEWYERAAEGDLSRNFGLLGHHWRLAGESGKAIDYFEKAGENAFRDFANREAIRFLEQALELSGPDIAPLRRARWHRLLGEARYRLTQIEASTADFNEGLALLGREVPSSAVGRGAGLMVELTRQAGHRSPAWRWVHRDGGDEREALLEAARAMEGLAEIDYNLGDFLAAFYCTMRAFNLAEKAGGASPELMRGYGNMCSLMGAVSLNGAADGYRALALGVEPQIDDLSARAWSRISLSTHSVWVGNWDRAEKEITEALAIYAQLGDWRRWGVAAWLWPQVAQSRGDLRRARDLWAELYEVASRSRDTRHQVRGRGGQFFNFLALDEPVAARNCLTTIEELFAANPEMMPVEERLWHAARAAWALHEGDEARAAAEAQETLAAIGRARFKFDLIDIFATPAEVLTALHERGKPAETDERAALKVLAGFGRSYHFGRPRALRAAGRAAWLAGDRKKAERLWKKSLAEADALAMPRERELTAALMDS